MYAATKIEYHSTCRYLRDISTAACMLNHYQRVQVRNQGAEKGRGCVLWRSAACMDGAQNKTRTATFC